MDEKLTLEQFGAKTRWKYPQYASYSNKDIAEKVLAKYPVYADKISDLPKPEEKGILRKVGDFFTSGTQKFGESIGQTFAAPEAIETLSKIEQTNQATEANYRRLINDYKTKGKDTTQLEKQLNELTGREGLRKQISNVVPVIDKSNKQILGEALMTGVEATGFGALKGVKGIGYAKYLAPTKAIQQANRAAFLAKPLSARLGSIGVDTAKMLGVSLPIGYTIDVANNLQEDKSGAEIFTPGLGTLISSVIPLGIGGVRAGRQITADTLSKLIAPNLSGVQSGAYERLRTGAKDFLGKATPESVLDDARTSASAFKSSMQKEFGQGQEELIKINELVGKRIGIQEKTSKTLNKIAERFGFEDRLPQNTSNMSVKETMDLLSEINSIRPITEIDDPLVRSFKLNLMDIKSDIMNRAVKEFGGEGGKFQTLYQDYATKKTALRDIQKILGKVGVKANSIKLDPVQQKTATQRLQRVFAENAEGYVKAIQVLEEETGQRILDKVAASQLSPILPKTLRGAPTGVIGLASDVLSAVTFPLSSPRIGAWLISKIGGYGDGLATKLLNASPGVRKAIYDAVNKENMAFSDAVELYAKDYIKNPRLGASIQDVSQNNPITKDTTITATQNSNIAPKTISKIPIPPQFYHKIYNKQPRSRSP